MRRIAARLGRRADSLRFRIDELSSLRELVGLPARQDITRRQWSVLELQLASTEARLRERLTQATDRHLPNAHEVDSARPLNAALGELELELSRAFTFFDTYMDVLTQRHTPLLGSLLAGCDVLACDAIRRDHPALQMIEPPVVFCDRGFGAWIVRENVRLSDGASNPMPLIQIPYSRLREKPNLGSIAHEAGHQGLATLGLVTVLSAVLRAAVARAGAPRALVDLFGLWAKEIGPDFWTFCATGIAAAGGLAEILALPPRIAFRVSYTDPHPPPFLRVLLAFELCRQEWGHGVWDEWEEEWLRLYPLRGITRETARLLRHARRYLPRVAGALRTTKFRVLGGRKIPDLFELSALHPRELEWKLRRADSGVLTLDRRSPCGHLAVFRLLKERGRHSEERLDAIMGRWLVTLGEGLRSDNSRHRKREKHGS